MINKQRIAKNPNIRSELVKQNAHFLRSRTDTDESPDTSKLEGIGASCEPLKSRTERKHKGKSTGLYIWIAASALVVILLAVVTVLYVDARDYQNAKFVPTGVTLNKVDLAGMDQEKVTQTVDQIIADQLAATITVTIGDAQTTVTVGDCVNDAPATLVDAIMSIRRDTPLWNRLLHDYLGRPIVADLQTTYVIDKEAIRLAVDAIAKQYSVPATNAKLHFEGFTPVITDGAEGYEVDVEQTSESFKQALNKYLEDNEVAPVQATTTLLKPKITRAKLMVPVLTVSIGQRQVMLWNGDELVKTYTCAVGQPAYPTTPGEYYIGVKEINPGWYNPAPNGWGTGAPKYIPGPNDALGLRGMHIYTLEGWDTQMLFHGALAGGLQGTATTHGCIRMFNEDVIDLYDRVPEGTRVSLAY